MKRFLVGAMALCLSLLGCDGGPSDPDLVRAHETCIEALRAGDMEQIYALSTPVFQQEMEEVASRLNGIDVFLREFEGRIPDEEVREALGVDTFRFPIDGSDVFRSLTGLEDFSFGPGIEAGLGSAETNVLENIGSVTTLGGETFQYFRDAAGRWRLGLAEKRFQSWKGRALLYQHLKELEAFMGEVAKKELESKKEATP